MKTFNKYLSVILIAGMLACGNAFAADQTIKSTEEMVGSGHPTKADTLNRLSLVEHGTDGKHGATARASIFTLGSDADGDVYYRASSILARLAKGTAYQQFTMNSAATAPEWTASLQSLLTAGGDIIYASAANTPARLAKGTDGQVLTLAAGIPSWAAAASGLSDASVTQAKLKTSTGSVSTTSATSVNLTLPGGEYGFYPQLYADTGGNVVANFGSVSNTWTTNIALTFTLVTGGTTAYARQRYVTSSGEVHWVFILRDKVTKKIFSMFQAPDHPCFGNGGKPLLVPHPFGIYDATKYEIIVINPSREEIEQMELETVVDDETKPNKDLLEVITENYEIDENSSPEWPSIPVTVGLPKYSKDKDGKKTLVDYRFMTGDEKVAPIKKVIPKPSYIIVKSLKRKK